MTTELVRYEDAKGGEISFTADEIKRQLCPQLEDSELAYVMALCQAQKLNPFTKDVYIQKFENKRDGGYYPASIITSKEVFTKRAQANPKFEGMQAGITVDINGQVVQREGSMLLNGWKLLGGWCKVYIKGYRVPIFDEVSLAEYDTGKSNWKSMPATMIRKVALCHALREAFPEDFQGLYGAEEMGKAGQDITETENNALESTTEPIKADFVEVASDETIGEIIELAERFAELCEKDTDDALEALFKTQALQGVHIDTMTPEQAQTAKMQLEVWIDRKESELEEELEDEDITF